MKAVLIVTAFTLLSCVDPLCGASEYPQRMSVRHFIEEEGFEKRCDSSGRIDLFTLDAIPSQGDLADVLSRAPFETFDVGDHDIRSGTYVQCTTLEDGEVGGLCSAFTLDDGDGVVIVRHVIAPDFSECYTSRDRLEYNPIDPISHN